MPVSDVEQLEQAAQGDADALMALLRQFGPTIRRRLDINPAWRSKLDAADVMQVTYLEAFLRIGQLKTRDSKVFAAWLTRIAENNLRDAVRQFQRLKRPDPRRQVRSPGSDESQTALLEQIGCLSATASRQAAGKESKALLLQAVARLPETYQSVVQLYDLEGQTPQEVADTLGRSVGAVHMLRARAHDRLRELLGSESKFFSDRA